MTNPDIELSTAHVRRHASDVDEVATMISEVVAGAAHVRASGAAYGQLVGPYFTPLLNAFQDYQIQEIKHAGDASQTLADLLRELAAGFDITDQQAARRLGEIDD